MFEKLAREAKKGDMEAKGEIIRRLQPLIISSIKRYYYKTREFEDLIQDGNLKVLECIEDYQAERGVYFLGYVKTMLRYMYLDKHKIQVHSSLNTKLEDGENEIIDVLVSDEEHILEAFIGKEEIKDLSKVLGDLTPRQREIIILFYLESMPMGDIASSLGISYRTVVNIKTEALRKMKEKLKYI